MKHFLHFHFLDNVLGSSFQGAVREQQTVRQTLHTRRPQNHLAAGCTSLYIYHIVSDKWGHGSGAPDRTAVTCTCQWLCASGKTVETDTAKGSATARSAAHRRLHAQAGKVRAGVRGTTTHLVMLLHRSIRIGASYGSLLPLADM